MTKRMLIMLLATGLFFGAVFGWKAFVSKQIRESIAADGPPVVTVSTTRVETGRWQASLSSVASLRSAQSVDVTAQVDGQITALNFDSGQTVERGTLLLLQYVADDQAQLAALQADLRLAELEVARIEQLVAEKLVPQRDLDAASSRLDRVRAEVESLNVAIGKKSIRAPFAGRLGIRQVNLGQYLEPGDPIVRLESPDRLFADFKLPQQALPTVSVGQPVVLMVDAWPGREFPGHIMAIEPAVDTGTRNVSLRATIDSTDDVLRPGMFAEIRIVMPEQRDVVLVPQAAVSFSPFGVSVYVVDRQGDATAVRNTYVTLGETRGDLIVVLDGLQAGQEIVTAGQLKLRDGARVAIDNTVPVSASLDPDPPET